MNKILLVHNFYKSSNIGGEDNIVNAQKEFLEKQGFQIIPYFAYNDEIKGKKGNLKAFLNSYFNYKAYNDIYKILKESNIRTILIHNTFPLISPSVILAAKKANAEVYMYLHNFRWLCCSDNFFINGKICHKCKGIDSFYHSLNEKCYKNAPLSLWKESVRFFGQDLVKKNVDVFICPSNTVKEIFVNYGFDSSKLKVLPHFVESINTTFSPKMNISDNPCFIIVGRLDHYKGIQTVLKAFKANNYNLKIIGDGPLRLEVEKACEENDNIKYLGVVSPEETIKHISDADFLIQASECYETFGLTIAEAYSVGAPVIGSDLGTRKEFVIEGETGFLFNPNDPEDLSKAIEKALNCNYLKLSENCIKLYKMHYTKKAWYKKFSERILFSLLGLNCFALFYLTTFFVF
ncbi:MAG: hypothetical protein A2287_00790 [Candidatus Melainabacteria bacterium RIFOXYA12_FULL_32_12]|nr:MAG: hypothetical protein A2287_00790 [Candidatus Melainabacteria bacterium RIFOXYA12_FULL_32_12]